MSKNIVLVGFMGVGKGRTARALAEKTGMYAVDCDDLIESRTNKKIKKIFKQDGEARFRELERQTALWLEESVTNSVISTGGGFINVPNIKRIGTVVYLHSGFAAIISSIKSHPNAAKKIKKRPLLADLDKAEQLYKQRLSIYRTISDIEVDVTGKSSEEVAESILSLLNSFVS